jgi:hypothetical protein
MFIYYYNHAQENEREKDILMMLLLSAWSFIIELSFKLKRRKMNEQKVLLSSRYSIIKKTIQ